jgi:AraC-like DNA-binding protein
MRRAKDIAAYVADPVGRYVVGPTFLHFFIDPGLCGIVFWGRPDEPAIRALTCALAVELPERCGPHATYVDTRSLIAVDEGAFQALASFVGARAAILGAKVTRQAIVRPTGVIGAMVAGFYDVTPSVTPERRRIVTDPEEAFHWMGRSDGPKVIEVLAALQAAASARPELLEALREHLAAHLRGVTVSSAARSLGVSPRTLQHYLRRADTSFRRELSAARVRAAQQLLDAGETKLLAIALDVGCASSQHFSTLFRKETGCAPGQWRARGSVRGAPAGELKK